LSKSMYKSGGILTFLDGKRRRKDLMLPTKIQPNVFILPVLRPKRQMLNIALYKL
jgi:hypothetical protein